MPRVINPLPGGKGASRRTPQDGDTAAQKRSHLTLVRPGRTPCPPPHRGMWHNDPIEDATRYTVPEDWPTDQDFEPLIAGAVAAGDLALAGQLEADRAFCAAARDDLARQAGIPRDSTA